MNVSFREDVQNSPPENARARLANATESDADRRTTAVMRTRSSRVWWRACAPTSPRTWRWWTRCAARRGVAAGDAVRLYRARCTSTRRARSVESLSAAREALREMGGGGGTTRTRGGAARAPLAPLYAAAAGEGRRRRVLPLARRRGQTAGAVAQDAQSAVETLAADLDEHRAALARVEEEAAQALSEAEALPPGCAPGGGGVACAPPRRRRTFADAAARGDALALELEATKQALAAVRDELAAANAAGGDTACQAPGGGGGGGGRSPPSVRCRRGEGGGGPGGPDEGARGHHHRKSTPRSPASATRRIV